MSLTAFIGIVAAFCTTVAFVPQIVKLRKQGGRGLSYAMLLLYLTGVLLWLAYGIRIHAVAMMWANGVAAVLVLISIVLKANPPAPRVDSGTRRLRIAVDMDEVIADSFSRHLSQYNQRAGANLTPEMISQRGLAELLPGEHRDDFNADADCLSFRDRQPTAATTIHDATGCFYPGKHIARFPFPHRGCGDHHPR